mgnify:CR=1 FL=1
MKINKVAIDSSMLVGLINPYDVLPRQALALRQALDIPGVELYYCDCVATEAISVMVRRFHEKQRLSEIDNLFNQLNLLVPPQTITWVSPELRRLYPEVLKLMQTSGGALNFNDALIALACREREISFIAKPPPSPPPARMTRWPGKSASRSSSFRCKA